MLTGTCRAIQNTIYKKTIYPLRADCYSLVNDTFPKINDQRSCLLTRTERLDIYAGITIANVILNMGRVAFMYVILIKASNALHNGMLASVLGLPIRFFDINPIGMNFKKKIIGHV